MGFSLKNAVGGGTLGAVALGPMGALPGAAAGAFGVGGFGKDMFGSRPPSAPDLSKPGTPDEIKALQARLDATQGPQKLGMEGAYQAEGPYKSAETAYQAKTFDGPLAEYDYARRKATESVNTQKQGNQEALARRFAALGGGLNSGSFIKQAEVQGQSADKELGDQMEGIGAQEAQAKRALSQAEDTKAFQSSEALKGRNFTAEQAIAQRNFTGQQSLFGRNAAREQYNADADWKDKVFRFDSNSKLAQMDLGFQQSELDRRMNQYNAELSAYQAQNQGGLLGAGGFLGTGFHI